MISSTKTQLTSARFLKIAAVLCLILQSSAHVLVLRYSRTLPGQAYLPSTAVVLSEVLKVMICIVVLVTGKRSEGKPVTSMLSDIFGSKSDYIMMAIPAGIYFIQNNLQYVALTLLDAATFQITNQMKLFTTAILSVMFLNTKLSIVKWISLLFMVFGIILVQLSGSKVEHSQTKVEEQILGLLCVVTASVLSGLAAVWFEYALKGKSVDLYIRNIQLGVFSIVPGLLFAGTPM